MTPRSAKAQLGVRHGRNHRRRGDWQCSRASIGAAAGAAAGALTGKIVQENQAAQYGPPPPVVTPMRVGRERRVFLQPLHRPRLRSAGVPPGGLTRDVDTGRLFRKPLKRRALSTHLRLQLVDQRLRFVGHLEQLRPGAVIIFARQFAGGVEPHVRTDVLLRSAHDRVNRSDS